MRKIIIVVLSFSIISILTFVMLFSNLTSGKDIVLANDSHLIYLPLLTTKVYFESSIVNDIRLTLTSPFMPGKLYESEFGDANQLATAFSIYTYQEISIISVPYGTSPPTESLPDAEPGGVDAYRSILTDYRIQQGGTPLPGPNVTLFGQTVPGEYSIVELEVSRDGKHPVLIIEWVTEALSRLWIVRISQDINDGIDPIGFMNSLDKLIIEGENDTSQILNAEVSAETHLMAANAGQNLYTLPEPPWWSGDCDIENYYAATGISSSRLGAIYDGLIACGPRPWTYPYPSAANPGPLVQFFPGAWGEYEWQCVELAMRFLYLKYGIEPYGADGRDVVRNLHEYYPDSTLEVRWNGTPSQAPMPGDVLSFSASSTFGHAAVVSSSNVNSLGNGMIAIIEQNNSQSGQRILPVENWNVGGSLSLINWLHSITILQDADYQLAYGSDETGNNEIYVINADGTGKKNLSNNANNDVHPNWSPNGEKIVFVSNRGGFSEIYTMKADGTDINPLSAGQRGYFPHWSPDGSKIAFLSSAITNDLLVISVDGSSLQNLTNEPQLYSGLDWSPDSQSIVLVKSVDFTSDLFIFQVDGSGGKRLTNINAPTISSSQWSPNGNKIAFSSDVSGNFDIYTINPDGSNLVNLTSSSAEELLGEWSPDGTLLSLSVYQDNDWVGYIMNIDGTGRTQITSLPSADSSITWSSDQRKIAFLSDYAFRDNAIYVMNADGTGLREITRPYFAFIDYPHWRPVSTDLSALADPPVQAFYSNDSK